jgi:hypothetical protein
MEWRRDGEKGENVRAELKRSEYFSSFGFYFGSFSFL